MTISFLKQRIGEQLNSDYILFVALPPICCGVFINSIKYFFDQVLFLSTILESSLSFSRIDLYLFLCYLNYFDCPLSSEKFDISNELSWKFWELNEEVGFIFVLSFFLTNSYNSVSEYLQLCNIIIFGFDLFG